MNSFYLTESQINIINNVHIYVSNKLIEDYTGHDIAHIMRVVHLSKQLLATEPQANAFIVIISAYLHDVIDDKITLDSQLAKQELLLFLQQQSVTDHDIKHIMTIIELMSYRKNLQAKQTLTLEGCIVQDADRLDAIGAIGIARTFYYGGNKKHQMHNPDAKPRQHLTEAQYRHSSTVINHFYEKLFLLKDQMNTPKAREIAEARHQFLLEFVDRFEQEWLI
ncbi:MAG: HD domain-containing protein [Candidatus Schmidhempelia sp.]|nr:HD domain-containing protein [Candidatus Schmidhempelia sp.]